MSRRGIGGWHGCMIRLKRFIRPEYFFSVVCHLGVLLLGLLFFGSNGARTVPPEPMTVELVPPSEAPPPPQTETPQEENPQNETPRVNGTSLESKSTGSEVSSKFDKGSATNERPQPKMTAMPELQQAQSESKEQRVASLAAVQPRTAPPEDPQPETQPKADEPILPPPPATAEAEPRPEDANKQPDIGELFAMPLALPGGRLGGGFDAPSATPAMLPHDDTAAFRARVTTCSHLPPEIAADEKLFVVLRVSLKRDGTLASPPEMVDATFSPKASVLMRTAVSALEKCQPYPELPTDKYDEWKTMHLVVTPVALSGR
jgi:hypothetical protein